MDRFYGFKNILEAMKHNANYTFVIIGFMNNEIKSLLRKEINVHLLQSRVYILPPVNNYELLDYAASADFGIIPLMGTSINTELSALNKVSEYLMSGLPILCSNYNNLAKMVHDNPVGRVGEIFDVNSIDSISNAIDTILKNKDYIELKESATRLAQEHYNWGNEEIKLLEIYETINTTA